MKAIVSLISPANPRYTAKKTIFNFNKYRP